MKAGNGFGKHPSEESWKFLRDRQSGKGRGGRAGAARPRKKKKPWHLDQARGAVESLWKEYERLMEEYMELRQCILSLENHGEGLFEKRRRVFRVYEDIPGWGITLSGEKEPPGTDGQER